MNYVFAFYLIGIVDGLKTMFAITGGAATFIGLILLIVEINYKGTKPNDNEKETHERLTKTATRFSRFFLFFGLFFLLFSVLLPDRKSAILMVVGGQTLNFLTRDSSASKIPSELMTYMVTEIRNLSNEAQLNLDISKTKQVILKEAENMSTKELIDKLKTDTTFTKILLNQ